MQRGSTKVMTPSELWRDRNSVGTDRPFRSMETGELVTYWRKREHRKEFMMQRRFVLNGKQCSTNEMHDDSGFHQICGQHFNNKTNNKSQNKNY